MPSEVPVKSRRGIVLAMFGGLLLLGLIPCIGLGVAWYFTGDQKQSQKPPAQIVQPEEIKLPELTEHEKKVNLAIERGAAYLEKRLMEGKLPTLSSDVPDSPEGISALMGLALFESGRRPDEPTIKKALETIRQKKESLTDVYVLACSLFFLNRLNEAGVLEVPDKQLRQTLALRLIAGQVPSGQWTYKNWPLSPGAENQLLKELRAGQYKPKGVVFSHSSNSMTQFAMLALWGARSHDVPVRAPLMKAAMQFHGTQKPDGAWGYNTIYSVDSRNDSNTCAGLLGLAIEDALRKDKEFADDATPLPPPNPDIAKIREQAFAKLGKMIGRKKEDPHSGGEEEKANTLFRSAACGDIYCLWCVERVAVIYDEKLLGGKDWYQWGSHLLLDAQKTDGSWSDRFEPGIDTCFAILFLKRANLARDLTVRTRQWRQRDR